MAIDKIRSLVQFLKIFCCFLLFEEGILVIFGVGFYQDGVLISHVFSYNQQIIDLNGQHRTFCLTGV